MLLNDSILLAAMNSAYEANSLSNHRLNSAPPNSKLILMGSLLAIATLAISIFSVRSATGQDDSKLVLKEEIWKRGFHGFAQLLRAKEIELLENVADFNRRPRSSSMVVAFGDVSRHREFLTKFLSQGGTVVLATDFYFPNFRTPDFELNISGRATATSVADSYQVNREMPKIARFRLEHPLANGVSELVTNLPARMRLEPRSDSPGKIVALYPPLIDGSVNQPFLFTRDNGRGSRFLALPDQSVFNNAMINKGNNLVFALNVIDWAKQSKVDSCLMLVGTSAQIPPDLSSVELWQPAPDAKETMEALKELWEHTTPREKLDLTNEALEFAQDEGLIQDFINTVSIYDFISHNRLMAILIVVGAWALIIGFIVFLMSNRKTPLGKTSIDGLKPEAGFEEDRRQTTERFRAAEAIFIHFFTSIGFDIRQVSELDVEKIILPDDRYETNKLRKEISLAKSKLLKKPLEYWGTVNLEELCWSIARWKELYETGSLKIESEHSA